MIKKLAAVLFGCLFAVFILSACEDSQVDGVMTEIKDDSGQITGFERRYHNDNGDITRLDVYDKDQVYDHYIIYEYDDEYRLIKETAYQADGLGDYYYTYEYDDDGNLIEKGYYTAKDEALITIYDTDGDEIERYHYDKEDKLYLHEVLENGKWVSYDADDNPIDDE